MGLVIDEDVYKHANSHGYKIGSTEFLWCPGVIGALSPSQRKFKESQGKVHWEKDIPPELKERIKKFQEGADEAEKRYNEEGRPGILRWLELMKREVEQKRGIPLGEREHLRE